MIDKSFMFQVCFREYQKGRVTPIKEKIKNKFDLMIFRQNVMKSFKINSRSKKYSCHHIFPKSYFPERKLDIDNGIPFNHNLHLELHDEYPLPYLLIDPISPIIDVCLGVSK